MNFLKSFNELSDIEKRRAREMMRKEYAGMLLKVDENTRGEHVFDLQLETIEARVHKILSHRILVASYTPEVLLFSGKKLYLHKVQFMKAMRMPEAGVFASLEMMDSDLYRVSKIVSNNGRKDCQVLCLTPQIRKVLQIADFQPYLPKKLQSLNLQEIELREGDYRRPEDGESSPLMDSKA